MKYVITINDKKYEVEVEEGQASVLSTTTIEHDVAIPAVAAVAAPIAVAAAVATAQVTGEPIKSPMPGVIVAVKVAPGTSVKRGDTILILEAMKMENEIAAPRDGVITQVVAVKGAAVTTGDILAAIQ